MITNEGRQTNDATEQCENWNLFAGNDVPHAVEYFNETCGNALKLKDRGRIIEVDVNVLDTQIVLSGLGDVRTQLVAELQRVSEFYALLSDWVGDTELSDRELRDAANYEHAQQYKEAIRRQVAASA